MNHFITTEAVISHVLCSRRAFFVIHGEPEGSLHDYESVVDERAARRRLQYLDELTGNELPAFQRTASQNVLTGNFDPARLVAAEDLVAACDAVVRKTLEAGKAHARYEPHLVVGTHTVSKEQKLALAYAGYVVGQTKRYLPAAGFVVPAEGKPRLVRLAPLYSSIRSIVTCLRQFANQSATDPLPLNLSKNCATCPFHDHCLHEAEETDSLTLLERMSPKLLRRYGKKGVFTVNQLSYLFKPRRRRRRPPAAQPSFNVELQALAIRTRKIYLHEPPTLKEKPVELYLDVEGVPDQDFHYLIGLLTKNRDSITMQSFWADTSDDEHRIFQECVEAANAFPNAPIYHYGSYEPKALRQVQAKHGIGCEPLAERLVNVNASIFGKVYFPSRSNSLKDLGALVGATWDSPDASGLQSLVWRSRWENHGMNQMKSKLISYNMSDCHALRLLTAELHHLGKAAADRDDVDFANDPKQCATDEGADIHDALEHMLWSGTAEYGRRRIKIRSRRAAREGAKKTGPPKGHPGYMRIVPTKANKTSRVRRRMKCPARYHRGQLLEPTGEDKEHTVIDLKFSKNGCRKFITKYVGEKARCTRCKRDFLPPAISRIQGRLFGHSFQAWAVYQRVVLRLPYAAITGVIENLFSEQIAEASIVNFVRQMADVYGQTEKALMRCILASPFVHVDETKLSIRGTQHYVWVLTNGSHVVFQLTETRETSLIQKMLAGYEGVLVSDFYGGYDSVECRQQKCLVHLIRDLNDDLWKNPFNEEVERFVGACRDLLVPIFTDVERYGLKARHLRKHRKAVDRFYRTQIDVQASSCEIVSRYRKRFERYSDSMFLFLQTDSIPWNNNMAERAIRHLAIQRRISGSFHRPTAVQYLRLLGIAQTCRFQDKSFLRFLLSEEKEVDGYRETKRPRSTRLISEDRKDDRSD